MISGHVRQKPKKTGRWYVLLEMPREAGEPRKTDWQRPSYRTRKEAEAALVRIRADQEKGLYAAPTKVTVKQYLVDRWLPAIEGTVKPTTFDGYKRHVDLYLVPRLGGKRLNELTPEGISALYASLRKSGKVDGTALAESTVVKIHATLHRALRDAVRWRLLALNSASTATKPKQRPPGDAVRAWPAKSLALFIHQAQDHWLYPALHLAAYTGMRRAEVVGLRWQDVDVDGGFLTVRHTITTVSGRPLSETPKNSRGRKVSLDPPTVAVLKALRRQQKADRLAVGPGWNESGLVFLGRKGTALHPDTLSKAFKCLVAKEPLLQPIRLHDLRHTHATLLLQAGVAANVVRERLGHSSVAFTLTIYAHVLPGMQEDAATRFASLVSGA